jgi:hypothetical protein
LVGKKDITLTKEGTEEVKKMKNGRKSDSTLKRRLTFPSASLAFHPLIYRKEAPRQGLSDKLGSCFFFPIFGISKSYNNATTNFRARAEETVLKTHQPSWWFFIFGLLSPLAPAAA